MRSPWWEQGGQRCRHIRLQRSNFRPNRKASWINQIEIWFFILVRKLLRRGNFTSKDHLKQRIKAFLAYFNATMAKPFSWTMKGKPLPA
jgi:hypothetical protein